MGVKINCTSCGKEIAISEARHNEYQGQIVLCPHCKAKTLIPTFSVESKTEGKSNVQANALNNDSKAEIINLNEIVILPDIIRKVPVYLMKAYGFIPIGLKEHILTCAFSELPDAETVRNIEYDTSYKIKSVLASPDEMQLRLKELFNKLEPQPELNPEPTLKPELSRSSIKKCPFCGKQMFHDSSECSCGFFSEKKKSSWLFNLLSGIVLFTIIGILISLFVFGGKGNAKNNIEAIFKSFLETNSSTLKKESLTKIIQLAPDSPEGHYSKGWFLQDERKYDEAIVEYKKAIKITPGFTESLFGLGLCYIKIGLLNEAMVIFQDILVSNPTYANAYYGIGRYYFQKNDWGKAVKNFKDAIKLNSCTAFDHLGHLTMEIG
jgi:tetratricopeptide (TPR) repeat protein